MDLEQRIRFVEAMATDDEITELAQQVFFSTDGEQARQLAAYIIARLKPNHEIEPIDAEISRVLGQMVIGEEIEFYFPNRFRKKPPETEAPDDYVPHRTCRKCRQIKPLHTAYDTTRGGNPKTKCVECEARDDSDNRDEPRRVCKECDKQKPLEEFGRNMDGTRKFACLECVNRKVSESHKRLHKEGRTRRPRTIMPEDLPKPNETSGALIPSQETDKPLPPGLTKEGRWLRLCSRGRLCVDYEDLGRPAPLKAGEMRWCSSCRAAKAATHP